MERNDLRQVSLAQLVESLQIIRAWNDSIVMLSCVEECAQALESDSILDVDEILHLCEPLLEEMERTQMVRESLTHCTDKLRSHRAALCRGHGMRGLPLEIVSDVFVMVSHEDHRMALSITHTSREWRRIALATPVMWAEVLFDETTNYDVDLLKMYLERSMQVPLRIEYYPHTDVSFQASFPLLLEHASRWCEFWACMEDVVPLVRQIMEDLPAPVTLPKLTMLNISSYGRRLAGRQFPPIHLPAIRHLSLGEPFTGLDPCSAKPALNSLDMCPTSLADFTSYTNLRKLGWRIQSDLVIEQGFQLDLPCLEEMDLMFLEGDWLIVSRLLWAMAPCHPRRLEIKFILDHSDRVPDGQLVPPKAFFSRVVDLDINTAAHQQLSTLSRINVEQILLNTPMLSTLKISGVLNPYSLLRCMLTKSFAPGLRRLELNGGPGVELIGELYDLLIWRQEEGLPALEYLLLFNCGKRSEQMVADLQELLRKVEWDR